MSRHSLRRTADQRAARAALVFAPITAAYAVFAAGVVSDDISLQALRGNDAAQTVAAQPTFEHVSSRAVLAAPAAVKKYQASLAVPRVRAKSAPRPELVRSIPQLKVTASPLAEDAEPDRSAPTTQTLAPEPFTTEHAGESMPATDGAAPSLTKPVPGARLTSGYGGRSNPTGSGGQFHVGLDFAASCGTPVLAAAPGVVTLAEDTHGHSGIKVQVSHAGGLVTSYSHNSALTVSVGERVERGQQVARMGTTGNSTGCHSHFETILNGSWMNPWTFLPGAPAGFEARLIKAPANEQPRISAAEALAQD